MNPNKLLSKLALSAFGFIFAFLILELFFSLVTVKDLWGFFREIMGERLRDCQTKDELLNHKLEPNCEGIIETKDYTVSLRTNSLGLRDKEVRLEKSKGIFRVLVVGDSFAEGWGVDVENRFDSVAEQMTGVEIINAGIRSYSPILELEYLRNFGVKLNPDLVIMFFDASDLHDDYYYGGWERHKSQRDELFPDRGAYIEEWPPDSESATIKFLKKSKLFSVVYSQAKTRILNRKHKFERTNLVTDISLFGKGEGWDDFGRAWNLNIANILLINDYLGRFGIDFAVAVVPRGIYVSANEWQAARKLLELEENVVYESKPMTIIEGVATDNNIRAINLLTPLVESDEFPLYYPFDGHWTVEGNKVVGRAFADFIQDWLEKKNEEI